MTLILAVILISGVSWFHLTRAAVQPRVAAVRPRRRLPMLVLAAALGLAFSPAGAGAKSSPAISEGEAHPGVLGPTAAHAAPSSQAAGYAARERQAKTVETFEGGDTVVIFGGSLLVIVLVVVLILVLI